MENMSTEIGITHMEHPEDDKILELLKNFAENAKDGFIRLETADRVFVVTDSDQHQQIKNFEGGALPLGEIEIDGSMYSEYSVNESFFKS